MEEEALPDHLRCNRSDGRQWRCKRRVKENMKLCELHYLQGRHRQFKEKVPESLKIQRMRKKALNRDKNLSSIKIRAQKVDNLAKLMKSKRSNETLRKKNNLKRGDMQLELIRMVLKREVEKRKSKKKTMKKEEVVVEENSEGELMRELPNGLMAISSSSSPSPKPSNNVGSDSPCNVKVGVGLRQVMQRRIRSKNVEPMPIGTLQVLPYARNAAELRRAKRKKCHWCQRSVLRVLTKCSSCQKQFFCSDCIRERYLEKQEEVEMACPVCRRTCTCKDCIGNHSKDTESKDLLGEKNKAEVILCFHYLICMLLPLLKEINQDQIVELETEAIITGKIPSNLLVKQAEFSGKEQCCCNKCKASILDLHRSCPNCSYNLCLSCCRDYQGSFRGSINMSFSKPPNKKRTRSSGSKQQLEKKPIRIPKRNSNSKYPNSSASPPVWNPCNGIGVLSCPPKDLGGCGGNRLDLRCLFPLSWAKELEVSAEEIVCSYDFPETSDVSSGCSLCLGIGQKAEEIEQLQEAAVREDSNDNFLYHPTLMDIHRENFEHFQKHWNKGHPVIVRNVLQTAMHLSWDPVLMFCTYLERSIARYENNKDLCDPTNFLDWCEVEIGVRQYFMGSLKGQTHTNMWNENLKLKGWISSHLFLQQFPAHYAEIIHALPFQEYMNPASGLLNLAARLPQDIPMPDLGPCVYISYGCSEELVQADSVIKLCYDSYDMVNILTHTSDVPVPEEQISRIRKLLKKHKVQNERESSRITSDKKKASKVRGKYALHGGEKDEAGLQNMIGEEMHLRKRVARLSCSSSATLEACPRNLKGNNVLLDGESDSDSDALLHCDTTNGSESSEDKKNSGVYTQSSNHDGKELLAESCGAQWDVFRRQDVPKLIEYLKRHSNEFTHTHDFQNLVIHPILDQSFFLDTAHKMKLKEEYKIEPWTFEQHVGEAVIIPAGCPYQIRSPKSCVHVVLDFISPESISECIQLTDEVRLLPEDHKAKVDKLEVKKIAVHSISSAIKEIRELTYPM